MTPNGVSSRPRLVLASASPRRRELLDAAGVVFDVHPVDVDETPRPDERPEELVARLARDKALAGVRSLGPSAPSAPLLAGGCGGAVEAAAEGSTRLAPMVVLAADTVVALDGEIFGKPACPAEARTMLSRLSGRCHEVSSGVAVATDLDRVEVAVERTVVSVRDLDAADIDCYVASGEPMDKAGAYGIQGRAGVFVDRVEGSYHNVVGLPLHVVDRLCWQVGYALTTWMGPGS